MTACGTTLRSLQAALHDHLMGRPSDIAGALREGGPISGAHRLGIYHHAYRARLADALRDAFEKTWAYLGDEAFAAAAAAYIEDHPSSHRNLRWYGADFPAWLAQRFPGDLEIRELAMLDWCLRNAFDGADARPVAVAALAALTPAQWEAAGCRFVPTLRIEPIRCNTAAIWQALDQGVAPPAGSALGDPRWVLVWRKAWQPHFRVVAAEERAALVRLRDGASIAALCAEGDPTLDVATVAAFLYRWIDEGLLSALTGLAPPS